MLAVVYIRVSTEEQVRHGYSLEAQEEACREKAIKLGASKIEVYKDEGYSGEILERPGLQAALTAAGNAAYFIVYDPDRLSRKLAHQLLLVETIEKSGCRLEFVTMNWQDTPEGRLFYSLRGAIAEYEKEKIKARSIFGKLAKAKRGLLTHDPRIYGYKYSGGKLEINHEQAEIYRRIVDMVLAGKSPEAIANILNDERVPGPGGGKWYRATVRRILKNSTYTGTLYLHRYNAEGVKTARQKGQKAMPQMRPEEEWISVPVPPLIEYSKWIEVQNTLEANKHGKRGSRVYYYPLTGLLFCGLCGSPMNGRCSINRHKKIYRYYACPNIWGRSNVDRKYSLPVCESGLHRADAVEAIVWQKVREWLRTPDAFLADIRQEEVQENIQKEITQLQKQINRLNRERERVFLAYRQELIDLDTFSSAVNEINEEKRRLEGKLIELEKNLQAVERADKELSAFYELAEEVADRLDELEWPDKEKLIRLLVRSIKITGGHIVIEAKIGSISAGTTTITHPQNKEDGEEFIERQF